MNFTTLGCVEALGMSDGRIKDDQITASDTDGKAYPHLARLHNMPKRKSGEPTFWSPPPGKIQTVYLQITFDTLMTVTGIATQGHYDQDIKEYASAYTVSYRNGGGFVHLGVRYLDFILCKVHKALEEALVFIE